MHKAFAFQFTISMALRNNCISPAVQTWPIQWQKAFLRILFRAIKFIFTAMFHTQQPVDKSEQIYDAIRCLFPFLFV